MAEFIVTADWNAVSKLWEVQWSGGEMSGFPTLDGIIEDIDDPDAFMGDISRGEPLRAVITFKKV